MISSKSVQTAALITTKVSIQIINFMASRYDCLKGFGGKTNLILFSCCCWFLSRGSCALGLYYKRPLITAVPFWGGVRWFTLRTASYLQCFCFCETRKKLRIGRDRFFILARECVRGSLVAMPELPHEFKISLSFIRG